MPIHLTQARCALSASELTLSSGVDVRLADAVGITLPLEPAHRRAFVLVPTEVSAHGVELDAGMVWRPVAALDLFTRSAPTLAINGRNTTGFESFDLAKLVARRLAYVADDGASLTFAVRRAA